jgi:hypothetical protein
VKNYEHSETFSRLKDITEKIDTNLTSLEYLQTLDMFLWNALAPIHSECPTLFHNYVAKIVANQALKASTKFTSLMDDERHKLPVYLFNMLTLQDARKSHEQARLMYLNRGLLFGFLALFMRQIETYEALHAPSSSEADWMEREHQIAAFEKEFGVRPNGSLYGAIQQVRFWYAKARQWKEMIIEKYARLALNHAKTVYQDFNHYVRLGDVVQIHIKVVSRAIDRCDPRQGVLTTFITNWFKSARSEVADLAKTQFDASYEQLAEELGDALSELVGSTEDEDGSDESVEHIAYLAKQIDRFGYVRTSLGIPEFLTREEKAILLQHALPV